MMALFVNSCTSFLEEEPFTNITADFIYTTLDGYESGTIALYNRMREAHGGEEEYKHGVVNVMHDLTGPRVFRGAQKFDSRFLNPASFNNGRDVVNDLNFVIDRANALLAAESNFDFPEGSEEQNRLSIASAEAKMFRALAYFIIYRQYNNVYLNTEPTNPSNFIREYNVADPKDVFDRIVTDISEAKETLPWLNDHGRWNAAAATHVLAKVYLWMGWDANATLVNLTQDEAFRKSLELSEELITDTQYTLVDIEDVFGTLSSPERDIREQYFVYKHSFAHPDGLGGSFHRFGTGTFPRYWELQGMKEIPALGLTFGWTSVNAYLMSRYGLTEQERNKDLRYTTYYMQKFYYNDPDNLPNGVQLGDEVMFAEQNLSGENYYRRMAPGLMKYLDLFTAQDSREYSDLIIFRKAETYLIAAEAAFKLGETAKSIEYINAVRRRAFGTDISTPNPEADLSESDLTIDLLLDENARELAMEGTRFYMLKRTGKFFEYMKDHSGQSSAFENSHGIRGFDVFNISRLQVQPHMVNFPYHQDIMDQLGNPAFQNPGYD